MWSLFKRLWLCLQNNHFSDPSSRSPRLPRCPIVLCPLDEDNCSLSGMALFPLAPLRYIFNTAVSNRCLIISKPKLALRNYLRVKTKCSQSPPRFYMGYNHHPVLWSRLLSPFSFLSVQATGSPAHHVLVLLDTGLCTMLESFCQTSMWLAPIFPLTREAFPGHSILSPFPGHPILYPFHPSYPTPLSPFTLLYNTFLW